MQVSGLNIYPVKSLRGIRIQNSLCLKQGLKFDRNWVITDERNKFISQRDYPFLTKIRTNISGDKLGLTNENGNQIYFPLDFDYTKTEKIRVWEDEILAGHISPELDNWLSETISVKCKLFGIKSWRVKNSVSTGAPFNYGFADGAPYLITFVSSLEKLNTLLESKISMDRFRSNIIIEGSEAFSEDEINSLKIGELIFKPHKNCGRCIVINTDQENGFRNKEPLKTLSAFRKINNSVVFGKYFYLENEGKIRAGDKVVAI